MRRKDRYKNTNTRRRNRSVPKEAGWLKVISIIAVPTLFLAAGAIWLKWASFAYEYDDINLCLKNRPLSGHTIMIVDSTDTLNKAKRRYLEKLIERTKLNLPPFSKFSIFTIDKAYGGLPQSVFSLCNPGSADTTNIFVQAPAHVQQKYEEGFTRPLEAIKQTLGKAAVADKTPLLGTIQTILEQGDFQPQLIDRKLILFSDMLEHSDILSHYSPAWEEKGAEIINTFPALLSGIKTEVHYVLREKSPQTSEHRSFWRDFFTRRGALYSFFTAK